VKTLELLALPSMGPEFPGHKQNPPLNTQQDLLCTVGFSLTVDILKIRSQSQNTAQKKRKFFLLKKEKKKPKKSRKGSLELHLTF